MSVHLDLFNAVNFASIHKAALLVTVKKVSGWTLMEELALVSSDKFSDLNAIALCCCIECTKAIGETSVVL